MEVVRVDHCDGRHTKEVEYLMEVQGLCKINVGRKEMIEYDIKYNFPFPCNDKTYIHTCSKQHHI